MSVSRATLFWIAHACMLVRSISLIFVAAVSRGKLYQYYVTDHVGLINESLASFVLAALELVGTVVTACCLHRHIVTNIRLQAALLVCLTVNVFSQCFLLVDIVAQAKQNTSSQDEYVDLFTTNLCGLAVFGALTSLQAVLYFILCVQSEARRCQAARQMNHTRLLDPKHFMVTGGCHPHKLNTVNV